jgi:hypothetical protein
MDSVKRRILDHASSVIGNLRNTADRLQKAVDNEDWFSLAEIQLDRLGWALEAVRGAAWVIANSSDKNK